MYLCIISFIIISIILIVSFILMEKSKFKETKKIYFKIFKIILVIWISIIVSIINLIVKKNIEYFDIIGIIGVCALLYTLLEIITLLVNSNFQKRIKIFKILILVILVWCMFFSIDYVRVQNNELPIFCFKLGGLQDGGTVYYIGIGYKVIDFHALVKLSEPIVEKKYICTWNTSYEEALEKVIEILLEE